MAPEFQSSFIPKDPVTQEKVFKKKKTSPLSVLALFLLILSILGAGGIYFYKSMIKKEIQDLQSQLAKAEEGVDKESIDEMSKFAEKLQIIEGIVNKHQVVSNFLAQLASSTVSTVYFTEFNYSGVTNDLVVKLHGKASDYASIALQEEVFNKNKFFKSLNFSNLTLAEDGQVAFDLMIEVDPQVAIYSPNLYGI